MHRPTDTNTQMRSKLEIIGNDDFTTEKYGAHKDYWDVL